MRRTMLGIAACVTLAGCLAPRGVPTRHYAIEPAIRVPRAATVACTVGVRPLLVARPYKLPMAYRSAGYRLAYRAQEEWTEHPGDVVTRAVTDALTATHRFSDVGDAAEMAQPDWVLTGEVRKFHENRAVDPPTAEVEVRLELRETRGRGLLWADRLDVAVPLADDSAEALADAMNAAVAQFAETAAARIVAVPVVND